MTPTIGRIVHYCLTEHDAESINRRRVVRYLGSDTSSHTLVLNVGNHASEGDVFPAMIVRVWPTSVNAQVQLDGNDTLWVTSVTEEDGAVPGRWFWPPRVPA